MTTSSENPGPADSSSRTPAPAGRGVRFGDVVRLLVTWGLTFLALLLTAELLPGFTYTRGGRC